MIRILFFAFFYFLLINNSPGQLTNHGIPFHKNFTAQEYGGEAQNWWFEQDSIGRVYVANGSGILVFDGQRWELVEADNVANMVCLVKDDEGNIYAAGDGTMGKLVPNQAGVIEYESLVDLVPADTDLTLIRSAVSAWGKVYFQDRDIVLEYDGSSIKRIGEGLNLNRRNFRIRDNLYFVSSDGIYTLTEDGEWSLLQGSEHFQDMTVSSINEYTDDKLLITTYNNGLYWYESGKVTLFETDVDEIFATNLTYTTEVLSNGEIAIAVITKGLFLINELGEFLFNLNEANILPNDYVIALYEDFTEGLWVGTGNGITRIEYPSPFTIYRKSEGLDGTIQHIKEFNGRLYIAAESGVQTLVEKLDISKTSTIVTSFTDEPFENWDLEVFGNKLYLASAAGIYEVSSGQEFLVYNQSARCLYRSKTQNRIYAGLVDGIGWLDFNDQGDLIGTGRLEEKTTQVRSIAEESDGTLWLGLLVDGVNRVEFKPDGAEITNFNEDDGLTATNDNEVFEVNGEVILATPGGFFQFDSVKEEFGPYSRLGNQFTDGSRWIYRLKEIETGVFVHSYNITETSFQRQLNGSYENELSPFMRLGFFPVYAIEHDPKSNLTWFGGPDGMIRYDPQPRVHTQEKFQALITSVKSNGDSLIGKFQVPKGHEIELQPLSSSSLRFEFGLSGYSSLENLSFQHQLAGFDDSWSDWGSENYVDFTNLNAGEYDFRLRVKDAYGKLGREASFSFLVLSPWYGTWWFLTISTLIAVAFISLVVRYFSQRKLIRKVEELELIKQVHLERERISRDLHDNIGSNLTYIISNLDNISHVGGKENPDLGSQADRLSNFTRDTMGQLRDTIWHLTQNDQNWGTLKSKLQEFTNQFRSETFNTDIKLQFDVDISKSLETGVSLNLYRICQEAINNIIKHANAHKIVVAVTPKPNSENAVIISISDDGDGFDTSIKKKGHYGLSNMKKRSHELNTELQIYSEKNKGTTIQLSLNT